MWDVVMSRRALMALGTAGLLRACGPAGTLTAPPPTSPMLPGPYETVQAMFGVDPLLPGMTQFLTQRDIPVPVESYNVDCKNGVLVSQPLPAQVAAAVYYPRGNPGPFPVLLFAHGVRFLGAACQTPFPVHQDYQRVETILRHVASHGCVAVAPDLSWLPPDGTVALRTAFDLRAQVLLGYYRYLVQLNATMFAGLLDLNRIILAGHSTGGGSVTLAGPRLRSIVNLKSLSYALLGPYFARTDPAPNMVDVRDLLVMHGSLDTVSDGDARTSYLAGQPGKTLVTIPGANHFGYTHLCQLDNDCSEAIVPDGKGTISRYGQQITAAAYLVAMLRYYARNEQDAGHYLNGDRQIEGLEIHGVTGIQIEQAGINPKAIVVKPSISLAPR
jgi:dienelactone hydrolase